MSRGFTHVLRFCKPPIIKGLTSICVYYTDKFKAGSQNCCNRVNHSSCFYGHFLWIPVLPGFLLLRGSDHRDLFLSKNFLTRVVFNMVWRQSFLLELLHHPAFCVYHAHVVLEFHSLWNFINVKGCLSFCCSWREFLGCRFVLSCFPCSGTWYVFIKKSRWSQQVCWLVTESWFCHCCLWEKLFAVLVSKFVTLAGNIQDVNQSADIAHVDSGGTWQVAGKTCRFGIGLSSADHCSLKEN